MKLYTLALLSSTFKQRLKVRNTTSTGKGLVPDVGQENINAVNAAQKRCDEVA